VSVADEARALFADAGLGKPPIPVAFEGQLRKVRQWHYDTRDAPANISPYHYNLHVDAARRTDAPTSLVLAHAGHGVNSYAISYYLVLGSVRILLQLAWGGVYMNNGNAGRRIRSLFGAMGRRLPELEQRATRPPFGELYHSDFNRGEPSVRTIVRSIDKLLASAQ
jgi:hypothetical protein